MRRNVLKAKQCIAADIAEYAYVINSDDAMVAADVYASALVGPEEHASLIVYQGSSKLMRIDFKLEEDLSTANDDAVDHFYYSVKRRKTTVKIDLYLTSDDFTGWTALHDEASSILRDFFPLDDVQPAGNWVGETMELPAVEPVLDAEQIIEAAEQIIAFYEAEEQDEDQRLFEELEEHKIFDHQEVFDYEQAAADRGGR